MFLTESTTTIVPLGFLMIGTLLMALFQTRDMNLKVESLDKREPKTCLSSAVARPTAFGMILAVFSLLTFTTERIGIWSWKQKEGRISN